MDQAGLMKSRESVLWRPASARLPPDAMPGSHACLPTEPSAAVVNRGRGIALWIVRGRPHGRIVVQLKGASHAPTVELGLDANDIYYFVVGNGERMLGDPVQVPRISPDQADGLRTRTLAVRPQAVEAGYSWIAIGALAGDGLFVVGHVGLGGER